MFPDQAGAGRIEVALLDTDRLLNERSLLQIRRVRQQERRALRGVL